MTLHDDLRARHETIQSQAPADVREIMSRGDRELAASGLAARALAAGDHAPLFTLPAAGGNAVSLRDVLGSGPVVLTFYRGGWCPYCNLALRALQQHHGEITARGARLVAVSPQVPDASLTLTERHALAFDMLSDVGCDVAKQYGIAFDLSDELGTLYDRLGFDLGRVNGGHSRTLPLPATFVVDRAGVIRWSFVDTDYTARAEPSDIVSALDTLR